MSIFEMSEALRLRVRGIVQGVGFRPFVYRLAQRHQVIGWVLNSEEGVEIHVEGAAQALDAFLNGLRTELPPAAQIVSLEVSRAQPEALKGFSIQESKKQSSPTASISPDLPVCSDCLKELFDAQDRRYHYPFINCTNCGPRYSIILRLPYDRPNTTMKDWALCPECARQYEDPFDRRFHAQPVACPACGPHYYLRSDGEIVRNDEAAMREAVRRLLDGRIVAVKGLGGYHLACDARNEKSVLALRERKYRKERPFALMVRDLQVARNLVLLSPEALALLESPSRPIVLAEATVDLPGVAPENQDLGVMLPYTPLHHLLFSCGAPEVLVMTSANRSSEAIAYRDQEAFQRLSGIADAFLAGERPIARRVDDSIVRAGCFGPVVLRRARGLAPQAVAQLPAHSPILALGADLKNAITLAVNGQAFVSQHLGDLSEYEVFEAFQETVRDLCEMYELSTQELLVVHDLHPEYVSTAYAVKYPGARLAVQHHRAHIASVIAERQVWDSAVVGFAFDGTGYGDDGSIWGGEVFAGSLAEGLQRVAHLRPAVLPGGDAAAQFPVQAAAGFLVQLPNLPELTGPPFNFPRRYRIASELIEKQVRTFKTTSVGRLFDTVAALLGFVREITFEGQAAMWLEHLGRASSPVKPYPFPQLDFRPLLQAVVEDRVRNRDISEIARGFHAALARGIVETALELCEARHVDKIVLSGGVFQNELLLQEVKMILDELGRGVEVWTNRQVPPNDGGISLGQAALGALHV